MALWIIPQKSCANANCSIDFGDFVLTGIPENFDDFTETSGGFGEDQTALYSNIISQLADSLKFY